MSIDLTEIAVSVISLIGVIITAYAVPKIKAATNEQEQSVILAAARTAVYAAQQIFGADCGGDKKNYTIDYMKNILKSKNISVSQEEISAAVEAALKEVKLALSEQW